MSRAFAKEEDGQWVHDIPPTMNALILYLMRENNGVRIYEKRSYTTPDGLQVHEMNNGLCYALDKDSKWYIVD